MLIHIILVHVCKLNNFQLKRFNFAAYDCRSLHCTLTLVKSRIAHQSSYRVIRSQFRYCGILLILSVDDLFCGILFSAHFINFDKSMRNACHKNTITHHAHRLWALFIFFFLGGHPHFCQFCHARISPPALKSLRGGGGGGGTTRALFCPRAPELYPSTGVGVHELLIQVTQCPRHPPPRSSHTPM